MPRDVITDQLRQLAELEASIDALKPRADQLANALRGGMTLEQAAAATGLKAEKVEGITRTGQDPRLFGQPELLGKLFAAKPGQVLGPDRGLGGYVAARLESHVEPDWNAFEASKAQMAQQLLDQRQRAFMERFTQNLRAEAKVRDLRVDGGF